MKNKLFTKDLVYNSNRKIIHIRLYKCIFFIKLLKWLQVTEMFTDEIMLMFLFMPVFWKRLSGLSDILSSTFQ